MLPRTLVLHSMFSLVGTLYVVWCGSQFCGGCWCIVCGEYIVCGGAWLGLAFGVGVVRECFVPTYGYGARTRASGGGRVFGAGVSWYGGSLVVARGWWSVWARALAGCFLVVVVGWLVGVAF